MNLPPSPTLQLCKGGSCLELSPSSSASPNKHVPGIEAESLLWECSIWTGLPSPSFCDALSELLRMTDSGSVRAMRLRVGAGSRWRAGVGGLPETRFPSHCAQSPPPHPHTPILLRARREHLLLLLRRELSLAWFLHLLATPPSPCSWAKVSSGVGRSH